MAAGFKYNLTPDFKPEEFYDVSTGRRRRGEYTLVKDNLTEGSFLPPFAPIYADKKDKFAYPVINVAVAEAYTTGEGATTLKIAKGSAAYAGMTLSDGPNAAAVTAVDKTGTDADVLTFAAAFGANLAAGAVLFEASTDGKSQKYVANSALYGRVRVDSGIVLVALLRTAAEIEPSKLVVPFSDNDKESLKGWFDFNE